MIEPVGDTHKLALNPEVQRDRSASNGAPEKWPVVTWLSHHPGDDGLTGNLCGHWTNDCEKVLSNRRHGGFLISLVENIYTYTLTGGKHCAEREQYGRPKLLEMSEDVSPYFIISWSVRYGTRYRAQRRGKNTAPGNSSQGSLWFLFTGPRCIRNREERNEACNTLPPVVSHHTN